LLLGDFQCNSQRQAIDKSVPPAFQPVDILPSFLGSCNIFLAVAKYVLSSVFTVYRIPPSQNYVMFVFLRCVR
jgi:hypothetical protein